MYCYAYKWVVSVALSNNRILDIQAHPDNVMQQYSKNRAADVDIVIIHMYIVNSQYLSQINVGMDCLVYKREWYISL